MEENSKAVGLDFEQKLKLFEDLLIGKEENSFEEFEKRINHFCPFEAIGMVRQEIRHSNFLSFILDPNTPHPFGDRLLKALLFEVGSQAESGQFSLKPLDVHFLDCGNAVLFRERANIDILIEIPSNSSKPDHKGVVVAIELKIAASESEHQLTKYLDYILDEYSGEQWQKEFVFRTLDATDQMHDKTNSWVPVSLISLVDRLDQTVSQLNVSGRAVDLFSDYSSMIRRNFVEDEELAKIARQIWTKHRAALDELYKYRPDLQAEIIAWLTANWKKLATKVQSSASLTLELENSAPRVLRFSVKEWQEMPGFCGDDRTWIPSGGLIAIELSDWGNGKLKMSIVLGPGDAESRSRVYEEVLKHVECGEIKIGRKTSTLAPRWKHLSAEYVQTERNYEKAVDNEKSAEELAELVISKSAKFLASHLPIYTSILRGSIDQKQ